MLRVSFENKNGVRKELGEAESEQEGYKIISDFLKSCNYKTPYWRSWADDKSGEVRIDVGSHVEFFVFKEV